MDKITFEAVDGEKQILMGAILFPEKRVLRLNEQTGEEFFLKFDADTIEKCCHAYLMRGYQRNSSENHKDRLEDVSLVETWIVEDPKTDKSALYGKEYPKGTWVGMMKVDTETYNKAKQGKLTGFSIDAVMPLKEVNFSQMTDIEKAVGNILGKMGIKQNEVKMGS